METDYIKESNFAETALTTVVAVAAVISIGVGIYTMATAFGDWREKKFLAKKDQENQK